MEAEKSASEAPAPRTAPWERLRRLALSDLPTDHPWNSDKFPIHKFEWPAPLTESVAYAHEHIDRATALADGHREVRFYLRFGSIICVAASASFIAFQMPGWAGLFGAFAAAATALRAVTSSDESYLRDRYLAWKLTTELNRLICMDGIYKGKTQEDQAAILIRKIDELVDDSLQDWRTTIVSPSRNSGVDIDSQNASTKTLM